MEEYTVGGLEEKVLKRIFEPKEKENVPNRRTEKIT
jgi:hypothetical protein